MILISIQFFGGRGSSSGRGGGSNFGSPKIKNPAGIPSNHMTEDEFLSLRGVGDAASGVGIDRYAGANMYHLSSGQRSNTLKEMEKQNDEYYSKRAKAKEEYKKLVSSGKIVPKTSIEKTLTAAHGHPDREATQAARRMAEKKGYDWRTGKKLK